MSYDVHVTCSRCGEDLMNNRTNMTSNLSRMWSEAGCTIRDFKGRKAYDMLPSLERAIRHLREDPEAYQQYEASNGWGQIANCIEFLERIRDACCRDPFATIEVNH